MSIIFGMDMGVLLGRCASCSSLFLMNLMAGSADTDVKSALTSSGDTLSFLTFDVFSLLHKVLGVSDGLGKWLRKSFRSPCRFLCNPICGCPLNWIIWVLKGCPFVNYG